MQKTQTQQAARTLAGARQFGDENAGGLANQNHRRPALAVDEQPDLPPDGAVKSGKLAGLFNGKTALARIAPGVEAGQCFHLAGFKALGVSYYLGYGEILPIIAKMSTALLWVFHPAPGENPCSP